MPNHDEPASVGFAGAQRVRFPAEIREAFLASSHPPAAARERVNLIAVRVRQIAGLFAALTVGWIGIDAATMDWPHWGEIALGRLATALAFATLALRRPATWPATSPVKEIGLLFAVSLTFFLYANGVLGHNSVAESPAVSTAYYFLPFVMAAGLSVFPLTTLESWIFGGLCVCAMGLTTAIWPEFLSGQSAVSTLWRLTLIAGIASLAGISQLHFLLRLTRQAARDGLTGLLVRGVGEELLRSQFAYAKRHDLPFSLLLIDLDRFKELNDLFGHDAGDAALRTAAANLRRMLRDQDIVIRWGGEEFVVALPGTDSVNAERAVRRMAEVGLGLRPNGKPITASIGIAEREADGADHLQLLAELSDQRMYQSKRAGRNRYLLNGEPRTWLELDA